jgi:hypothetical protein
VSSIAILIDVENIAATFEPAILTQAREWGTVAIVRLYGDFTGSKHSDWCKIALAKGYETILQLNGGRGKNSTDIAMTIGAMDILHANAVDGLCIVSNDRDFVPLATRIRGAGRRAYAICLRADVRTIGAHSETFALAPSTEPSKPSPVATPSKQNPVAEANVPTLVSRDERAFMLDLVDDLCQSSGKPSISLAVLGLELRKRNQKLADRIGSGKLLKWLVGSRIVIEHGSGSTKTVSANRAA